MKCRQGKSWSEDDKKKKSTAAKQSQRVVENNIQLGKDKKGKLRVERIVNLCLGCNEEIETSITQNKKYHLKCWRENSGGLREGSGRGKQGWYKDYFCQSSYELAWVVYHLEHNMKFERNLNGFEYKYEGKSHKYYPDFILEDGTYVELKGFADKKCEEKIKQFEHQLVVLFKDDLKPILEYTIERYGKDFIRLYE